MTKLKTGWIAALAVLVSAGSLAAHHSLTNYDTSTAVRVKGAVVQFQQINPHSFLFVEGVGPDGQARRWAIEGPSVLQLNRRSYGQEALKPGSMVEVCGYLPKETITWQITSPDPGAVSLAGRLINAEVLTMPDGKQQSWGDYGVHKCFAAGFTDQHTAK